MKTTSSASSQVPPRRPTRQVPHRRALALLLTVVALLVAAAAGSPIAGAAEAGGFVAGVVRTPDGVPLSDVSVHVVSDTFDEQYGEGGGAGAISDAAGNYSTVASSTNRYGGPTGSGSATVYGYKDGYIVTPVAATVVSGSTIAVDLVAEPFGTVSGTVRNESGTGLADARIKLRYDTREGPGEVQVSTAADGSYDFSAYEWFPPGPATITATPSGADGSLYAVASQDFTIVGGTTTTVDLVLPPKPAPATVSGTMDGADALLVMACPGSSAQVFCNGMMLATMQAGAYEMRDLAPGTWTITGARGIYGTSSFRLTESATVELTAGEMHACTVVGDTISCSSGPPPGSGTLVIEVAETNSSYATGLCRAPAQPVAWSFECSDGSAARIDFVAAGSTTTFSRPAGDYTASIIDMSTAPAGQPSPVGNLTVADGATTRCTFTMAAGPVCVGPGGGDPAPVDGVSSAVEPGGSVSTAAPGGQTAADPLGTTIVSPVAGSVTIDETGATGSIPAGYAFFGNTINIEAPRASVENPLRLTFDVDASLIPNGETQDSIQVFRDGAPIDACTDTSGTATPDPCVTERTTTSDGDVRIAVLSSHASAWNLGIITDHDAPVIDIASPGQDATFVLNQPVTVHYGCTDGAGSGVVSCEGTVADGAALDTTAVGTKTIRVDAVDAAGNSSFVERTYRVVYDFKGFLAPVDALPVANRTKAGSAVPLKFTLGGNQGLAVLAAGSPSSVAIPCDVTAQGDTIEQTVTTNSGLAYDAASGTYTYVWKTDRAWAGTCRQLIVKLADGTEHRALFNFTR